MSSRRRPAAPRASTTHTRAWQHPFVDVFRAFNVSDWKSSEKLGDVSRVIDPEIGKVTYRVVGNVAASNCIHIPRGIKSTEMATTSHTVARGSLNLTGRFVYVEMKPLLPRYTTLHLDVLTVDKFVYRLSFSNVFRTSKIRGQVAQIPTRFRNRWTVFAVDLPALLESVTDGVVPASQYKCLKGIQLCASMIVRNVFTSDNAYAAEALPREMAFPVTSKFRWSDKYDFLWVPYEPMSDGAGKATSKSVVVDAGAGAGAATAPSTSSSSSKASGRRPRRRRGTNRSSSGKPTAGTPASTSANPPSAPTTPQRRLSAEDRARSKSKSPLAQGMQGHRRSPSVASLSSYGHRAGAADVEDDDVLFGTQRTGRAVSPPALRVSSGPQPTPQSLQEFEATPRYADGGAGSGGRTPSAFASSAPSSPGPRTAVPRPAPHPSHLPPSAGELSDDSVWEAGASTTDEMVAAMPEDQENAAGVNMPYMTDADLETTVRQAGIEVLAEASNILRRAGVVPASPNKKLTAGRGSTVPTGVLSAGVTSPDRGPRVSAGATATAGASWGSGAGAHIAKAAIAAAGVSSSSAAKDDARQAQAVVLQPDPIMTLSHVVGMSGTLPSCVLWSPAGDEIVFACSNLVVAMHLAGDDDPAAGVAPPPVSSAEPSPAPSPRRRAPRAQRHFIGHTDDVCCLALSNNGRLMVTGQAGQHPTIRVWDFSSRACVAVLGGHVNGLGSLGFSVDDTMLVAHGLDAQRRLLLLVWDISRIMEGEHSLVARQVADFPVTRIKFSPYDPLHLVSCGRENIRFWRIKNGHLPGCPVILNQYARGCEFTDLAFESSYGARSSAAADAAARRVFVSSAVGTLLQVNYDTKVLECVFRLHDGPIHSVAVNEGFCVTASADRFLRVWPLDFSDFYLEARHEGAVTSCAVSPDGIKIAVGTAAGTVGALDVSTHAFHHLLRSHTADVVAMAVRGPTPAAAAAAAAAATAATSAGGSSTPVYDNPTGEIATVSLDGTIRVWNAASCDQLYEFNAPGEVSQCIAYHPFQHVLVCGFENGLVRVFDIPRTCLLEEYRQHRAPVRAVCFTPDGKLLFSAAGDGHVCAYDAVNAYTPLKVLSGDLPPSSTNVHAAMAVSPDGRTLAVAFSQEGNARKPVDALSSPPPARAYAKDSPKSTGPLQPVVLLLDPVTLDPIRKLSLPVFPRRPFRTGTSMLPSALSLPVSATGLVATITGPGVRTGGVAASRTPKRTDPHGERLYRGLLGTGAAGGVGGDDDDEDPPPVVTELTFAPDGSELVASTTDWRVVRWGIPSGDVIREVRSTHRAPVQSLDISPNGTYMLTGGHDKTLKIWDREMRGPPPPLYQAFIGHVGPVRSAKFLHHGEAVVSVGGGNGVFFLWNFHGDSSGAIEPPTYPFPPISTTGGAAAAAASSLSFPAVDDVPPPAWLLEEKEKEKEDAAQAAPGSVGGSSGQETPVDEASLEQAVGDAVGAFNEGHAAPGQPAFEPVELENPTTLSSGGSAADEEDGGVEETKDVSGDGENDAEGGDATTAAAAAEDDIWGDVDGDGDGDVDAVNAGGAEADAAAAEAVAAAAAAAVGQFADDESVDFTAPEPALSVPAPALAPRPPPPTPTLWCQAGVNPNVRRGLLWHPPTALFGHALDNTVVLEDLATRAHTMLQAPCAVHCLALSQSGTRVAAGMLGAGAGAGGAGGVDTLMVWEHESDPSSGGDGQRLWMHVNTLVFPGGKSLPVLAIGFSPSGRYLAAVGQAGSGPLGVHVAVWDVTRVDAVEPVAARALVFQTAVIETSTGTVVTVEWQSDNRFVTAGSSGVTEFEVRENLEASPRGSRLVTQHSLRYRTVLKPDKVVDAMGMPTALTCLSYATVAPSTDAEDLGVMPVSPSGAFVAGDGSGTLWIARKVPSSDKYTISSCVPVWDAEPSSTGFPITDVAWRGEVAVLASSNGRVTAIKLNPDHGSRSVPKVRGTFVMDSAVTAMVWDGAAFDGVVLTASGSVSYTRWGVEPLKLTAGHTAPVDALASTPAKPYVFASAAQDRTIRLWETSNVEQVMELGPLPPARVTAMALSASASASDGAAMTPTPATVQAGLTLAVGYETGVLQLRSFVSEKHVSEVALHRQGVTQLAWASVDARSVLVSGDGKGRVFLSTVGLEGATVPTPRFKDSVRLDNAPGSAAAIASLHKGHAIVGLDVCPTDPSRFLVASRNGRVTVWRLEAGDGTGPAVQCLAALVLNFVVADERSVWYPLAPLGTASAAFTTAAFAPQSDTDVDTLVCLVPTADPTRQTLQLVSVEDCAAQRSGAVLASWPTPADSPVVSMEVMRSPVSLVGVEDEEEEAGGGGGGGERPSLHTHAGLTTAEHGFWVAQCTGVTPAGLNVVQLPGLEDAPPRSAALAMSPSAQPDSQTDDAPILLSASGGGGALSVWFM